jgi:hypothetical protein
VALYVRCWYDRTKEQAKQSGFNLINNHAMMVGNRSNQMQKVLTKYCGSILLLR